MVSYYLNDSVDSMFMLILDGWKAKRLADCCSFLVAKNWKKLKQTGPYQNQNL